MTEKKRLPEQMALHSYRHPVPVRALDIRPSTGRREVYREERRKERSEAPYTSQRVVTVPEADPSTAWNTFSARRKQMRQERLRPRAYVKTAPRTFAQTGMWASSGRIRAIRAQSGQLSSPVPTRSGRVERKRNFFWRLISALFIGGLLILTINFSLTSNTFRIAQVEVEGTHNAALIHQIQSMGMQGQNVFLVNIAGMTERIAAIPLVASVNLSRQLPNQLVVTVVERTPALLWQTAHGTYSVDGQGVVIAPAAATAGADHLQTVVNIADGQPGQGKNSGSGVQSLQPGTHLDQAEINFALLLLGRLPKVVGLTTFKLYYDGTIYASDKNQAGGYGSRGSYVVESPDGWKAYLGDATDANPLDNRLLELQQILALAQKQQLNIATIDLRYGLHPVYTLR
jgi:cell division septal protein FtsQ